MTLFLQSGTDADANADDFFDYHHRTSGYLWVPEVKTTTPNHLNLLWRRPSAAKATEVLINELTNCPFFADVCDTIHKYFLNEKDIFISIQFFSVLLTATTCLGFLDMVVLV